MTTKEINEITKVLKENGTKKLAKFNDSLTPGALPILGVKIPKLRKMAKEIAKKDYEGFLNKCPEIFYEQQLLKAFVIGYAKDDVNKILGYAKEFVPHIHDWAVNDGFCQTFTIARKNRQIVYEWLMELAKCDDEFKQRVVAVMLMSHFLVDDYIDDVLCSMNKLKNQGYYAKMGVAWCLATAYAKYPEKTKEFLANNQLDDWTYNKSIQKMLESYRISDEDKEMLRKTKRRLT